MKGTLVCVLFGVIMAVGCTENLTAPLDVVGGTWQLVSINQGAADPIVVDTPSRYTLRLNEDGRAAVKSDCNSCGGSYTLDNATVAFAPLACTRAFCGDSSLDQKFSQALAGVMTVSLDGSDLRLTGGAVTLRFKR